MRALDAVVNTPTTELRIEGFHGRVFRALSLISSTGKGGDESILPAKMNHHVVGVRWSKYVCTIGRQRVESS
jgi:hypothetical protein